MMNHKNPHAVRHERSADLEARPGRSLGLGPYEATVLPCKGHKRGGGNADGLDFALSTVASAAL